MIKETKPIPEHHKQWFDQLLKAATNGDLALMSGLDAASKEDRSILCLVHWDKKQKKYLFTPVGHLTPNDNPFEAYIPAQDLEPENAG